jgi:hypothetical protein
VTSSWAFGVGRIAELVDEVGVLHLVGEAPGEVLVILRVALGDVRAGQHHLGAHGLEVGNLLAAHLVRDHQDQAVALLGRHQGEAEPGVARRALDQRRARPDLAGPLRVLDHFQADAVLDRAARILALQLDEKFAGSRVEVIDAHDRRVADQFQDILVYGHGSVPQLRFMQS